ncbi:MAG TPA: ATP-binding protein [Chloroflexota bacterium]|nr:ATP-binding protein [Chloroflexota bacterium]
MENPFVYGDIATGISFTNREEELRQLQEDARSGQNVVIISPRRYGKTSLVVKVMELLRQEGVLIAYVDLFRTPSKVQFADHLAGAIYGGMVAPFERVFQRAVSLFQQLPLRPRITVGEDGSPSFEFTAGQPVRDLDTTIEHLLGMPGRIARERRRKVALVLDEFQEVLEIDPHLPATMRSIFQFQPEVAHIFLGSKQRLMQQVFTERNVPLYRMAKPMRLGPIAADKFAAFIRARFTATSIVIDDAAIERILSITGGLPQDTQELCHFVWSLAQRERLTVTAADVDRALASVIEAEDARYTLLWDGLSRHQRLVLIALSAEPGGVYAEGYRQRHRLGSPTSVQRSITRLVEREIVEPGSGEGYHVPDVFLRSWIARLVSGLPGT